MRRNPTKRPFKTIVQSWQYATKNKFELDHFDFEGRLLNVGRDIRHGQGYIKSYPLPQFAETLNTPTQPLSHQIINNVSA